jgi:hypothetical protein
MRESPHTPSLIRGTDKMNVIDLGRHRDLLKGWDEVHAHLRRGRAKGFALMLIGPDGEDSIYLGGNLQEDPEAAARAGLRLSLEVVKKTG